MRLESWFGQTGAVRVGCLVLGLAAAFGVAAQTPPVAADGKDALIARLLHPPRSPWMPEPGQLLAMMADVPMRRLFKSMSDHPDWGPAHPQWRRQFSSFRDGYLKLVTADLAAVELLLAERLRAALSDAELAKLTALLADAELERVLRQASRLGLDLSIALRTTNLNAAPDLYTPDEIAQIKTELTRLQGRDEEMLILAVTMQAVGGKFKGPEFERYQEIMIEFLQPIAAATVDEPEFRRRFDAWSADWRQRLKF